MTRKWPSHWAVVPWIVCTCDRMYLEDAYYFRDLRNVQAVVTVCLVCTSKHLVQKFGLRGRIWRS